MSIKVLHTADIHFGMENYGRIDPETGLNHRLIDFVNSMNFAIDYALENDVDLVILAGDIYKTRDPSPTWQREFAKCMHRFAEESVPVVIVSGNHDIPNTRGKAHSINIFETLAVPNFHIFEKPNIKEIQTKNGKVQIAALPYLTKSFILSKDEYKNQTIEQINELLVKKGDETVRWMADQIKPDIPAILVAHVSVANAVLGTEQSIMAVGADPVIPLSTMANPKFDYVALGHIHRHQIINPGGYPAVVYPGSIDRVDFGEENEEKGFVWIDLKKGETTFAFKNNAHARKFVTIELEINNGDPYISIQNELDENKIKDAVVRVVITTPPGRRDIVSEIRIRDMLGDAYHIASIHKMEAKVEPRSRDSQMTESLSPVKAVEQYLQTHSEFAKDRKALLDKANKLMQELEEAKGT